MSRERMMRVPRLSPRQTTLCQSLCLSGIGLHTGRPGRVTVKPSPPDSGISFVSGAVRIPAWAAFVVSTRRCTCLGMGEVQIDTVEHLLSALWGLGIDNAEIAIEGPEVPILDGSARPWVEAIQAAGICQQEEPARVLRLEAPVSLRIEESWLVAIPATTFTLTCVTEFDHPLLGIQTATFRHDPQLYAEQIAPARTFGFAEEVKALQAAGLAQGGTFENALVIYPDHFSDVERLPQECLRHKALDLFGDLSLIGRRLQAAVTAIKPGHRANTAFAALLAAQQGE